VVFSGLLGPTTASQRRESEAASQTEGRPSGVSRHRLETYLDKVFGFSDLVNALPEGRQSPKQPWKKGRRRLRQGPAWTELQWFADDYMLPRAESSGFTWRFTGRFAERCPGAAPKRRLVLPPVQE
jgi:hypothetical protein